MALKKVYSNKKKYSYNDAIKYLYDLEGLGICPGLARIKHLLNSADNPQNKYPVVLVAGTNGKGSVSTMIAAILTEAGYKTGLFTSPHIDKFNERIKINGKDITNKDLSVEFGELKKVITSSKVKKQYGHPTFFECNTFMAYNYFARNVVDIAVVEVGLGGRLDSTNVVDPIVSVITSIGYDHEKFLGSTVEKIAKEKAGIIKKSSPVVVSVDDREALSVILKKVKSLDSQAYLMGKHFTSSKLRQYYKYNDIYNSYGNIDLSLKGTFQKDNLATSLMAVTLLKNRGFNIEEVHIRNALKNISVPGRFEYVTDRIILDVAHNCLGAKALRNSLNQLNRPVTFVVSMMADKDVDQYLKIIACDKDRIIVTSAKTPRALGKDDLENIALKSFQHVETSKSVATAVKTASLDNDGTLIVVTGSFFTVSEARKYLKRCKVL